MLEKATAASDVPRVFALKSRNKVDNLSSIWVLTGVQSNFFGGFSIAGTSPVIDLLTAIFP